MLTKIEDISIWLKATSYDKKEKQRREAIHILLDAIASSEKLNAKMAMKGGVLLAIKYSSSRYTIDVDFSSSEKPSEIDIIKFYSSSVKPKILFIQNVPKKFDKLSDNLENLTIVNI